MVKKSIQKKKKTTVGVEDVLKECTSIGHLKSTITSRIQVIRKNLNVTLLFEDGVQICVEFKEVVDAVELVNKINRWNKRSSVHGLELIYKPKDSKEFVVRRYIHGKWIEKGFSDSKNAFAYFENAEELSVETKMKKMLFELYCIGDEKGERVFYDFSSDNKEFRVQFDKDVKVFVNSVQHPTSNIESVFLWPK